MSDVQEAAGLAKAKFDEGATTNEVISSLAEAFDECRFYEANGKLYMEDDDGRFPPRAVCDIPKPYAYNPLDVLEYAANNIAADNRRGVFVKAFVEGEEWAVCDFERWKERN